MSKLNNYQIKAVLNKIFDGCPETFHYIMRIHQFYVQKDNDLREQQVLLWFVRNGLIGKKFVQFFKNEGSFLDGMNTVVNRIEGRRLVQKKIKINELY